MSWLRAEDGIPRRVKAAYLTDEEIIYLADWAAQARATHRAGDRPDDVGKAVASHVSQLAKRDYPAKLPDAMDFLVCYVPSEELLAAAYESRPILFYDAARDGVLIAGPATLLSILWGIAHGLQHDARARHGQEIGESAAESTAVSARSSRTCRGSAAL